VALGLANVVLLGGAVGVTLGRAAVPLVGAGRAAGVPGARQGRKMGGRQAGR
jgi:hypothetical protein